VEEKVNAFDLQAATGIDIKNISARSHLIKVMVA
jgi:hypothetical protein